MYNFCKKLEGELKFILDNMLLDNMTSSLQLWRHKNVCWLFYIKNIYLTQINWNSPNKKMVEKTFCKLKQIILFSLKKLLYTKLVETGELTLKYQNAKLKLFLNLTATVFWFSNRGIKICNWLKHLKCIQADKSK